MNLTHTSLSELWILEPKVFEDSRGFFFESYNEKVFVQLGITARFVQDNVSRSRKGVLRGLHYQLAPMAQGKLVRVSLGEVFDVVVDLRRASPTFGKWFGITLSEQNKKMVWIPPGFAHGFLVLSDIADSIIKSRTFTHLNTSAHCATTILKLVSIGQNLMFHLAFPKKTKKENCFKT